MIERRKEREKNVNNLERHERERQRVRVRDRPPVHKSPHYYGQFSYNYGTIIMTEKCAHFHNDGQIQKPAQRTFIPPSLLSIIITELSRKQLEKCRDSCI